MTANRINPQQWNHAISVARQSCARVFRDGGAPADALEAFGLAGDNAVSDWSAAVEMIAQALCTQPAERAAA